MLHEIWKWINFEFWSTKNFILAREVELKELKEEHEGLEAASSDQVEVAEKFQKMALNMEEDIEAQKDEIQMLHTEIEEQKEQLTRQVSENDVLKEKEAILQNQILKHTQDLKTMQTEFEVRIFSVSQAVLGRTTGPWNSDSFLTIISEAKIGTSKR